MRCRRSAGKSRSTPATDAARQWEGWGTALKPAFEPIVLARKPLSEKTVAANVLRWGTGALNIDGCRVPNENTTPRITKSNVHIYGGNSMNSSTSFQNTSRDGNPEGRWPANVVHDGSDEVVGAFPNTHGAGAARKGSSDPKKEKYKSEACYGEFTKDTGRMHRFGDNGGSAARFFYSAKADADDRIGSKHPTVKPVDLMQWICRLVTPNGGTLLDPFSGTGTTGEAAFREGFKAVLIEREVEYQADIRRRMALCMSGPDERKREAIKAKVGNMPFEVGSLFAGLEAAG